MQEALPIINFVSCPVENCQNCLEVDSEVVCKNCVDGYFLENGQCESCQIPGCRSCYSSFICRDCKTGNLREGQCVYPSFTSSTYYAYKLDQNDAWRNCYIAGCGSC